MGRIVFTVVVLVLLTVVIVMNLGPTTPINLFGARFQNVPVVAVAMLSFALGLVYSLFLYIGQYFRRSSRERLTRRSRDTEEREKPVPEEPPPPAAEGAPDQPPADQPASPRKTGSIFSRIFRALR